MAIANETVVVAVCDACGKRTYGDPGQQPKVITGHAQDLTGDREKNAVWSACGPKHVGPAVATVLKKATPVRVSTATPPPPASTPSIVRPAGTPQANAG